MPLSFLTAFLTVMFWCGLLFGIIVIPIGLPGTFIIAILALVYGYMTGFAQLNLGVIAALFAIAVAGEVVEFFLGAAAVKKSGASNFAFWGTLVGGIIGSIWATGILPIIGTVIGAFVGAFLGAALFEFVYRRDFDQALHAGWGAFLGTLSGKMLKIIMAIAMVVIIGFRIL